MDNKKLTTLLAALLLSGLSWPNWAVSEPRGGLVKLSPEVRVSPLDKTIPTIPLDAIRQFLIAPHVLDKNDLDSAPYVVAHESEHIVNGAGGQFYARNISGKVGARYSIFRQGDTYYDPDLTPEDWMCHYRTQDSLILGYGVTHVGVATVLKEGDPATLSIVVSNREVLPGDRLLVVPDVVDQNFHPHIAEKPIAGRIIEVQDALQVGQFQIVVLSRGKQDGVEIGHVFAVDKAGKTLVDPYKKRAHWQLQPETVTLPDEPVGSVMVFAVFERVSYALVMKTQDAVHKLDKFHNPPNP